MNSKNKTQQHLPESELFPANASWLAGLIGVIILAFSLSIAVMLSY